MRATPNSTMTNRKAMVSQPSPARWLERVSGADEACMLYTVNLFPKIHTVDLNRHRISCNPYIQNVTDSRDALCGQDNAT
jgi:hypothetical protein